MKIKKILACTLSLMLCYQTMNFVNYDNIINNSITVYAYSTGMYKVNTPSGVKVRSEANTSSTYLGASSNGTEFEVTQISGNWGYSPSIYCTNGYKSGWVYLVYCEQLTTSENKQYLTGDWHVNTPSGVKVRSEANTSSTYLGASSNGTEFKVTEISGNWGYTPNIYCTNGYQSGWVYLYYCTLDNAYDPNSVTTTSTTPVTTTVPTEVTTTPVTTTVPIEVTTIPVTTTVPIEVTTTPVTTTVPTEVTTIPVITTINTAKYLAYDIDFDREVWNFINSSKNFGSSYYITDEDYLKLIDGLSNTEIGRINTLKSNYIGECYGMSTIVALYCQNIINSTDLQEDASCLKEVKITDDVKSKITYYFLLQAIDPIYKKTSIIQQTSNESTIVKQLVTALEKENSYPYVINYGMNNRGHSVVGYGVEYGSWENYPNYDGRILVYDNKSTEFQDENCIYFNSETYNWYIPYQKYGWNGSNTARLYFFSNSSALLNYHGLFGDTDIYVGDDTDFISEITVDLTKSIVSKTESANSFVEGYLLTDKDLIPTMNMLENNENKYLLNDSQIGYSITSIDNINSDICVNLLYPNCSIDASMTNGYKIALLPNGTTSLSTLNNEHTMYEVTEILNDLVMPWSELTIKGTFKNNIIIKPTKTGFSISGLTEGDMLKLSANDLKMEVEDISCLYKIPKDTTSVNITYKYIDDSSVQLIVISADDMAVLNEDTTIYGDVNSDEKVNILDIIELKSYLFTTANTEDLTINYIGADLSLDNEITTMDLILLKKKLLGIDEGW